MTGATVSGHCQRYKGVVEEAEDGGNASEKAGNWPVVPGTAGPAGLRAVPGPNVPLEVGNGLLEGAKGEAGAAARQVGGQGPGVEEGPAVRKLKVNFFS